MQTIKADLGSDKLNKRLTHSMAYEQIDLRDTHAYTTQHNSHKLCIEHIIDAK